MKIEAIKIQNFKSIKDITINCNKGINVFIGKNGTGKSAAFEAIDLLFKTFFQSKGLENNFDLPSEKEELCQKRCFIRIDFYGNDKFIELIYDRKWENDFYVPFTKINSNYNNNESESIFSKRLEVYWELFHTADRKNIDKYRDIVTNQLHCEYQESVYQEYEPSKRDYRVANTMVGFTSNGKFEKINPPDGPKLVGAMDKAKKLTDKEIKRITDRESDGKQALFLLEYILKFKELNIQHNIGAGIIAIDEPELYLHPHAKKSLYNKIKDLAELETQIFYITHSSEFLSYENSEQIHRFYIDDENGTQNAKGDTNKGLTDRQKTIKQDKISLNDVFLLI